MNISRFINADGVEINVDLDTIESVEIFGGDLSGHLSLLHIGALTVAVRGECGALANEIGFLRNFACPISAGPEETPPAPELEPIPYTAGGFFHSSEFQPIPEPEDVEAVAADIAAALAAEAPANVAAEVEAAAEALDTSPHFHGKKHKKNRH